MSVEFTFAPGLNADALPASATYSFFFNTESARATLMEARLAGFRRIIIDDASGLIGNFDLAGTAAALAPAMEIVLTHWAGVLSPSVAASEIAALDRICQGRLALRMLTESIEGRAAACASGEQATLLERTDEYLTLLKRLWSNDKPFDHEGPFYSLRKGFVPCKGPSGMDIPIRIGGQSDEALRLAARHAHVVELSALTPEISHGLISRVRDLAAPYGRADKIRFALQVPLDSRSASQAISVRRRKDPHPLPGAASLAAFVQAGISEFMLIGDDGDAPVRFCRAIRRGLSEIHQQNGSGFGRAECRSGIQPLHGP